MSVLQSAGRRVSVLLLGGASALLACGDSPTTQETLDPVPAVMTIVSGNSQSALAGTELPAELVVRVVDAEGAPVESQIVNFLVTAGGGSVSGGTALTDSEGLAQDRWTVGAAGDAQGLEARAVDAATGDRLVFAVFSATALPPPAVVTAVSVSPSASNLIVGGTQQLTAAARDQNGDLMADQAFSWSSSDSEVATVTASGLVTGVGPGTAEINASAGEESGTATMTVSAGTIPDTEPPGVPGSPSVSTQAVSADSFEVSATWGAATDASTYTWTTGSNSGAFAAEGSVAERSVTFPAPVLATADGYWFCVAAVDSAGNASESSACGTYEPPTAPPPVVAAVVVAPTDASLAAGDSAQFTAAAEDEDGDPIPGKSFDWTSTDTDVATVDADGLVIAIAAGSTTIRASVDGKSGSSSLTVTAAAPTVATVTVAPATASLTVGGTRQLTATARDADGDPIAGKSFTWTSSDTDVATVGAGGLVSAVAAGSATITAAVDGKSGTSAVTVTPAAPVVATVVVDPAEAGLEPGETRQLSATARDASGTPISGKSFEWSTGSPAVASVSSTGLVTANAAGSAVITATVDGRSGNAEITVTDPDPGPGGGLANECASAPSAWIWCDDFDQDRLSSYFEYDDASGAFVRLAGVGMESSSGMRARFGAGAVGAGSLKLAFGRTPTEYFDPVDAGTSDYREIYFRFYFKNAANWTGGGGDKMARAISFARSDWSEAMIAHVWSGNSGTNLNHLLTEAASGTDEQGNLQTNGYNDFANLRWIGSTPSATPVFDGSHVGQWYCVESRVRLNDAGQSNGAFQLWIDGALEANTTGLNWVGAFDAYGINSVFLENFWNSGSPQQQDRFFDNLVVSTQRIGCGS